MQTQFIVDHEQASWQPLMQSALWQEPMSETRLLDIARELGSSLVQCHAEHQRYAQWDVHNVFVHDGHCYLLRRTTSRSTPLMAFEQLAQDSSWPVGPAADVYGLGMLLRTLILKQQPPMASARWLEELMPLHKAGITTIQPRVLRAIDLATELDPALRLGTVDEFLLYMNVPLQPVEQAVQVVPVPGNTTGTYRYRALAALILAVTGLYLFVSWSRQETTPSVDELVMASPDSGTLESAEERALLPSSEQQWTSGLEAELDVIQEPAVDVPMFDNALIEDSTVFGVEEPMPELEPEPFTEPESESVAEPAIDPELESATEPVIEVLESEYAEVKPPVQPTPAKSIPTVDVPLAIMPWGEVYVDNRRHGASPPLRSLKLTPGSYQIQIRNGDLPPYTTRIEISEGNAPTIRHRF